MKAMLETKYLIIGASHAGLSALDAIRAYDPEGTILMATREKGFPYSPTVLPYVIAGEKHIEDVRLRDSAYFHRAGIRFLEEAEAVKVLPSEKSVFFSNGEAAAYEKLLLATGADAAIPPFPGIETVPGRVVRTLADALKLKEEIGHSRSAFVVGAGLIAMHSAENLSVAGLRVTVLVRRKLSLFSYFDAAAAGLIERIFAEHGVRIAAGSGVSGISPQNGGCRVALQSGEEITADLLLLATGVRPRIACIAGSGIAVDQGILVDDTMRTSAPDVWAAGDVAQARGFFDSGRIVTATLPNASVQGRTAGMGMAGDPSVKPYPGSSGLNTFRFFGNHAFSVGMATVTESAGDVEVNTAYLPSSRFYQKLVFKGNCLIGASAINARLDPGILRELIQKRIDLGKEKERFARDPVATGRVLMTRLWR